MRFVRVDRIAACSSLALLAACGGGGGGGGGGPFGPGPSSLVSDFQAPKRQEKSPVFASEGGPDFSDPDDGTEFPLTNITIGVSNNSATAFNLGQGVSLTFTASGYRLEVPTLGIDTILDLAGDSATIPGHGPLSFAAATTDYSMLGAWTMDSTLYDTIISSFIAGYQTPDDDVPTVGTGVYADTDNVSGFVVYDIDEVIRVGALRGDGSITANFATGTFAGTFTNMTSTPESGGPTTPWNNVSVTGWFLTGDENSRFEGTATTTSTNGHAATMPSADSGHIGGFLTGPHAEELIGMWSLHNVLSEHSAAGYIHAEQAP